MVRVVLVGVEGAANLGFILRLAMNFDVDEVVLVNPRQFDWDEVRRFAAKAHPLVDRLRVEDSIDAAFGPDELRVCTSAVIGSEDDPLRQSTTVEEYRRLAQERGGRVALVFGRESTGLTREELKRCDVVVTIPTSPRYPELNLSHAVAIMLYETYVALSKAYSEEGRRPVLASPEEREELEDSWRRLVECLTGDEAKRERLLRAVLSMIRRGNPRKVETRATTFLLRRALRRMSCA